MKRFTQIGIVDESKKLHREFAIKAMDEMLHVECSLSYELWREGAIDLLHITHTRVDKLITDIMFLKRRSTKSAS